MKRLYTDRVKCAHEGCLEMARYEYHTRREALEGKQWRLKHPYRCTRHTNPEQVLSPSNLTTTKTMTVTKRSYGQFWDESSGFQHGPGFKAFADDFPEGTKLTITATIQLP